MPDLITPADEAALQRRRFLRGGALLAAAAGGAVVATASSALPAAAADGDPVLAGEATTSASTTTLALDPGAGTTAALTLTNPAGPALVLTPPTDLSTALPVGGLAGGPRGLRVGVRDGDQDVTAAVLTSYDLQGLPVTFGLSPSRVLNTKDDSTYGAIVASSSGAFDSQHRLKKGAWVDIALLPTDEASLGLLAAHLTLTALGSTSDGSMTACPPGEAPDKVATLPFDKGRTVATGVYTAVGVSKDSYAVRVYTSATTHLKLDVSGFTVAIDFADLSGEADVAEATRAARVRAAKHVKQVGARARVV